MVYGNLDSRYFTCVSLSLIVNWIEWMNGCYLVFKTSMSHGKSFAGCSANSLPSNVNGNNVDFDCFTRLD